MMPVVLSIAGSDSGGGAGIQADIKTFQAFGTFGTTAITAITAQNTLGVTDIHAIPIQIVEAQIRAVAEDFHPAACKSGMLATRDLVARVAECITTLGLRNYVLDPVMVATSGARLLERDAEESILKLLVPIARLVTPNLDEAAILTGIDVKTHDDMRKAARVLVDRGARAALIKGGHLPGNQIVDVLYDGRAFREWSRTKIHTSSTHGTGCTLSAAIAAGLAHGHSLQTSVGDALDYLQRAIVTAPNLGSGNGPVNHSAPAKSLATKRPRRGGSSASS
jgi:hydroxymethylpyrimidine/phosphomethylpyrimidine kinase